MKSLHLAAHIRSKRRYNAYMGEVGRKAANLIQRQFTSNQPMEKVIQMSQSFDCLIAPRSCIYPQFWMVIIVKLSVILYLKHQI